jgi:hypothetical protein
MFITRNNVALFSKLSANQNAVFTKKVISGAFSLVSQSSILIVSVDWLLECIKSHAGIIDDVHHDIVYKLIAAFTNLCSENRKGFYKFLTTATLATYGLDSC